VSSSSSSSSQFMPAAGLKAALAMSSCWGPAQFNGVTNSIATAVLVLLAAVIGLAAGRYQGMMTVRQPSLLLLVLL
jgi:hypothetical protein